MVNGQFSLSNALTGGGSSESGSSYPRIKLAGPLGQLIGGQGISLNSGLGQVLSSIISGAASGSSSNSNSGGPLSQLATAASTQYINAIRALPFGQFGLGGNGQSSGGPPQSPSHQPGHHGGPPGGPYNGPMYPGLSNSMNFMNDASMGPYGGQNFDAGAHFGPNSFPQFSPDNYFGGMNGVGPNGPHGQFGGYGNHGPPSGPLSSSALYSSGPNYGGHHGAGHHYQSDK